ncbi:methionine aminopeptidase [Rufibacter sp. DG15C]|uniref:type I methionyl aminopeptidase n=1 Tax=Rufibacter sp. DG15C TaxID=1379909 RepID=UPI00078D33D8|nr:type I methionyl aminopeptidase [Rufibacter sp. DG15C]AMM52113.1 methionine aminopeptidase [Rufibacter sp. DG15C]
MSIESQADLAGIHKISEVVATTLRLMREHATPGMTTQELDDFGFQVLQQFGAQPAPKLMYDFPGYTCISVNKEVAHGIPSKNTVLQEGDLVNIDVSAELNGFYADNGGSFILGQDLQQLSPLVKASQKILNKAIQHIRGGVRVAEVGRIIETEAKKAGFKVIKNLAGHGVGRSLHESPEGILNYYDPSNRERFKKNSVVAIETFISTHSTIATENGDGWTLVGNRGGHVAQHEHTILITDKAPIILTKANLI